MDKILNGLQKRGVEEAIAQMLYATDRLNSVARTSGDIHFAAAVEMAETAIDTFRDLVNELDARLEEYEER